MISSQVFDINIICLSNVMSLAENKIIESVVGP